MNNTITIPAEEYKELKNRVRSLEETVAALVEKVEKDDIFVQMVNSEAFQKEMEEDVELLKKDPSQFTDLFEAYRKQKTQ